jgi:hypothetical protein
MTTEKGDTNYDSTAAAAADGEEEEQHEDSSSQDDATQQPMAPQQQQQHSPEEEKASASAASSSVEVHHVPMATTSLVPLAIVADGNELRSTTTTTPGAVAINNTSHTNSAPSDVDANTNDNDHDAPCTDAPMTMMLEATAVHEIIATQVQVVAELPLPMRDDITLQHVDIDNFDDSTALAVMDSTTSSTAKTPQRQRHHPPYYHIVLIILGVVVALVGVVCIIFGMVVPPLEEPELEDKDNPCLEATFAMIHSLEQLKGKALVEFCLACAVLGVQLYQLLEAIQNRYCLMIHNISSESSPPQPHDDSVDSIYANFILFLLEFFWCVMVTVLILGIHMEGLNKGEDHATAISSIMEKECSGELLLLEDEEEWLSLGTTTTIHSYYIWACLRLPLLTFLLVARGKLLVSPQTCEHVTVAWKRCWRITKGIFELILYAMSVGSLFGILSPVLQAWIDYADEYS